MPGNISRQLHVLAAGFILSFVGLNSVTAQPASLLQEARALIAEANHAESAALLESVPQDSLSPRGCFLLGLCYQSLLQHHRALEMFGRADTLDPEVQAAIGRSLELLGQVDEARSHYLTAYRIDSTDQAIAISLARLYADAQHWKPVHDIYLRLLELDPDNPFLHAQLGVAYHGLDSTEASIIHLQTSFRLNPKSVKVALQLSSVYMKARQHISARRVLEQVLAIKPHLPAPWIRLGEIALTEETYDVAEESFRNAMACGDSSAANLRNLGVSLYLLNRYDEAESYLLRSFKADSTDGMNAFYLGMVRQQEENWDESLMYLNKAADLMGQEMVAEIYSQIAADYDRMNRDDEALQTYRLVRTLAPKKREVLFHLAALYDNYLKDSKRALSFYEQFLTQLEDGDLPQMKSYADVRIREIREKLFFEEGRMRPAAVDSSAAE